MKPVISTSRWKESEHGIDSRSHCGSVRYYSDQYLHLPVLFEEERKLT